MQQPLLKTRLAPTPSGYLHLGNAWSFVLTWLIAKKIGAKINLRIDDLDGDRVREEYIDDIFQSLQWLGLTWDEGPRNKQELKELYSQKKRKERYSKALKELSSRTSLLYYCECSRKRISQCTCKQKNKSLLMDSLNERESGTWRINTDNLRVSLTDKLLGPQTIVLAEEIENFVVRRQNGEPAYQFFSVIEDVDCLHNCIVRGRDLLPSSAAQLLLAEQAGLKFFQEVKFYHHGLLVDESGRKLSKYDGDFSLQRVRERKGTPDSLYRLFAGWLGCSGEGLLEMLDTFTLSQIPKADLEFIPEMLD